MESALSFLLLGGLYIISNRREHLTEGFISQEENSSPSNYPVEDTPGTGIHTQHTDKYFNGTIQREYDDSDYTKRDGNNEIIGLTGNKLDPENFQHSNMKPFFGGKLKGGSYSNNHESILDNTQGNGSQHISKKEQAPLFKPQQDMGYSYGAPNESEFIRSRINPSLRNANTKPWEEQRVAPGLSQGFTNTNSNIGYNNGMEHRELWMPRTVDDLRVQTNPKESYMIQGRSGPANSAIKENGNVYTQGKIEKRCPDTDYELGPTRWFTTTSSQKAQPARGTQLLSDQNRSDTSREYYGNGTKEGATYVVGESSPIQRNELKSLDISTPSATGHGPSLGTDHGKSSYTTLPNNRTTTKNNDNIGGVYGSIRAIVSPIMDIVRQTKKEDIVSNIRPYGNVQSHGVSSHLYDPSDRTKVTIKEQTGHLIDGKYLNLQKQGADAYTIQNIQPSFGNRSEMNVEYVGNAGYGVAEHMNYDAAYRQHNNDKKTHRNRPHQGGMSVLNGDYNMSISKNDMNEYRAPALGGTGSITTIPCKENIGATYTPDFVDTTENRRNDPDILKAFKENPYTQSLNSY
jgi:hypothetical protein